MEQQLPAPASKHRARLLAWSAIGVAVLAIYGWLYYFEPFAIISRYLNDKITDTFILIPAIVAATLGIQLTRQFKPAEPPYRIWLTFSIGWWFWVGGELLGYLYDYFYWYTEYPEFTWIDACWVLGYIFFGLSLYYQFRLLYFKRPRSLQYLGFIALAGLIALGLTQWALQAGLGEGYSTPVVYLSVLYPVFDIFEGGAALWLFFLFGRGYLGRPWWGLISFAVADSINIYSWMGGFDNTPEKIYYAFDLVSAVTYMAGYVITALAFASALDHIHRTENPPPGASEAAA
ncbi:MAG: hypothetical protein HFACDABA_01185 [Anaerolineales bacterium]|nr:hypothetical protein [Anaerolineales bacterium]